MDLDELLVKVGLGALSYKQGERALEAQYHGNATLEEIRRIQIHQQAQSNILFEQNKWILLFTGLGLIVAVISISVQILSWILG